MIEVADVESFELKTQDEHADIRLQPSSGLLTWLGDLIDVRRAKSCMTARRLWIGVLWRIGLALVLCLLAFQTHGSPVSTVLDLPVSTLNAVLPVAWQSGFANRFRGTTYDWPRATPTEMLRYLRVGVPAWFILLSVPMLVSLVGQRNREESRVASTQAPLA
jgi:hypothetical protein